MSTETQTSEIRAKPSRSAIMVDCLRAKYLYCEKRARDIVFDAAEAVIGASHECALRLHRLRRLTAERAQAEAAGREYVFANWDMGTKTTLSAMLQAGVLLTHDGETIPANITAEGMEVVALQPDFRDQTESFLLEFLIRELGDVSIRDHTALAHALFRQFNAAIAMDELQDRVALLLASLARSVALQADGTYVYCGPDLYAPAAS
jgi:hypothetical protein